MKVNVFNKQADLRITRKSVQSLVNEVVDYEGNSFDEVSIYFVSAKKISRLHLQFFDDPSVTDCISFPIDAEMMGDVFVCPKAALLYADNHNKNPYHELTLYVVHALLHLMGYDDIEKKLKATMRKAEGRHLKHIEKIGLWLHP